MIENAWLAWFILLLPLGAFVLVGVVGRRLPEGGGHGVVGAMAGSFILSLYIFVQVLMRGGLGGGFPAETLDGHIWIPGAAVADIRVDVLIYNLSARILALGSVL